jgi:peptidoglycan L-alanyl-D-glutamate endopeptidase CwlK
VIEGQSKLLHLTPLLALVIERACRESAMDVIITETVRTVERQRILVRQGASRTLRSKHLQQLDGFSHAVDVAFRIDGEVRFDWPLYFKFADFVRKEARKQGLRVTWGAIWDTPLNEVNGDLQAAHAAYVARFQAKKGRKPLADGPHFQLG